jgi:hypothetical protein
MSEQELRSSLQQRRDTLDAQQQALFYADPLIHANLGIDQQVHQRQLAREVIRE